MSVSITSVLKGAGDVLHRIRVKLYPNYLPKGKGTYIAHTNSQRVLDVDDICKELKTRGSFPGDHKVLAEHVRQYFDEAVYQLCNGFAVNSGYYTMYPNIGGIFTSPNENRDQKKHPLGFRIRVGSVMKQLAKLVEIEVEGVSDNNGYIDCFTDIHTNTVNDEVTGGFSFIITGDKIKIGGDDPDCGVYFEMTDRSGMRIKVQERLTQNTPSKIIGTVPALVTPESYRVVIVTQFNGSSTSFLKNPRTLISNFEIDAI